MNRTFPLYPDRTSSSRGYGAADRRRRETSLVVGWLFYPWVIVAVVLGVTCDLRSAERVPWVSSRVEGSPDPPPPYRVQPAFPQLTFDRPVVITDAPGSDRLFVAEQSGRIYSFVNDAVVESRDLVIDLKAARPELNHIYGLTFHPDFQRNRFVFICYVTKNQDPQGTQVSRFTMSSLDPPKLDADSEYRLLNWLSGGHNGGCLKFGPDGYLYIATGDAERPSPPDDLRTGQDVSDLLSSILRIDVDQQDEGLPYRIPPDNPLLHVPGARGEIWAYGFRNPWKMSFDRVTGELFVGDVGWELWEMIYRIEPGGNYGWSIVEGRQPVLPEQEPGPTPILPPLLDHPHSEAASITGGFVYRGVQLASLTGTYIYGDYQSGLVWGARVEDGQVVEHQQLAQTPLQLVGFGEDQQGELFLLDHQGQVYELVENQAEDTSARFPRKLSQTGLFQSLPEQRPAAGVLSYDINAKHWADFTSSERWLAIPQQGQITIGDNNAWQFPNGSVLAKTVSFQSELGVESSRIRLETQVLHREDDTWRPYTYVWNEMQTDADLLDADGESRVIKIRDQNAPRGVRELTYRFAGRQECLLCHNPWVEAKTTIFGIQSASLLGVSTAQLNVDDQLHRWRRAGILDYEFPSEEALPRLADPYDVQAGLDGRARSYLHVNCAHCHQFNAGGTATILLAHDTKLDDAQLLDVRPTQGTFGIPDARIVAPGDPFRSVLYYRVSKLGGGRMPRLGSSEVDSAGTRLLFDWIASLTTKPADPFDSTFGPDLRNLSSAAEPDRQAAIERLITTTPGALMLLDYLDRTQASRDFCEEIALATQTGSPGEVRDLFERFLPASERTERLGENVDAKELLRLPADPERGRQIFLTHSAAACKNCHRIGNEGETLGPDLTKIGGKYPPEQLLQQILDPSRSMDPKYVPHLVETSNGRLIVGLIESQNDEEVVMRDAKNQVHRLPTADIEHLARQQKSIMPELLLRDMTRQEVADLLAFLSRLK